MGKSWSKPPVLVFCIRLCLVYKIFNFQTKLKTVKQNYRFKMANFLKDLPCKNADNFTRINPDSCHRSTTTKKSTYIPVKDIPADQVIVTEKTNILLR